MTRTGRSAAVLVAVAALAASGCQSLVLAVANQGVAAATATELYDEELGLALDVFAPAPSAAPAPVVVFFHGGGWKTGSRGQYRFVGERLARSGMLAIVADYRTYPTTTFPGFIEDGARAVAWARHNAARHGGDPTRLFVAGHSAGAQIAALIGTDARYLAVVGLRRDQLAGVIGLSGPYNFTISGGYAAVFGPPQGWPLAQAVNHVDGDEPPFLLVHGTGDRVVEARDSQQLADRLRAAGGTATLVWLPGAGHAAPLVGLFSPQREPRVLAAIEAFVQTRGSSK